MKCFLTIAILPMTILLNIAVAQEQLSRKQIKEKLDQVERLISIGDFEMALMIYQDSGEPFLSEKVPKSHKGLHSEIEHKLFEKQKEFEQNAQKVRRFKSAYDEHQYCEASELLKLSLTTANATSETIRFFNSLTKNIEAGQVSCQQYRDSLAIWTELESQQKYEQLWFSLEKVNSNTFMIDAEILKEITEIRNGMALWSGQYQREFDKRVVESGRVLRSIRYPLKSYSAATQLLDNLGKLRKKLETPIPNMTGGTEVLSKLAESKLRAVSMRITEVERYCKENKPPTKSEILSAASNGQSMSYKFIQKHCVKMPELGGLYSSANELFYVYDLDVISYFSKELDLQTDLQKKLYEESTDFKQKLEKLKNEREDLLQSIYFREMDKSSNELYYVVEEESFLVQVGSDKGFAVAGASPPKCINRVDASKCDFLTLDLRVSKSYNLLLPIPPRQALEVENRLENVTLFFIFQIRDKVMDEYVFTDGRGAKWDVKEPVFRPSFVRLVLLDDESHEVYFDKTYK